MPRITIEVDGVAHDDEVEARLLLVHYLRDTLGLTGTVAGCDTSNCGSCTVLIDGRSAKSCTVLAVQAGGSEVLTIEGLADHWGRERGSQRGGQSGGSGGAQPTGDGLGQSAGHGVAPGPREAGWHPLQEAFHTEHALQCGYCTPGMIMASVSLLADNPDPSEEEIRQGLEGNLCRCTGYQNIVKAVRKAAGSLR